MIVLVSISCVYAETITFSANSMNGTVNDNANYTRLIGNASVTTDAMELNADEIELTGDDYRYIIASGDVSGVYSEAGFTFSCDSIRYDRETKIAILEGTVSMVDTENDVDLKAQFIEYNQTTEVALIQINVEIIQGESFCTAAFALYRKESQILELSGSPKITQGEDIFQAHEIIFNLETEEITLVGRVQGTVTDTNKEESSQEENQDE